MEIILTGKVITSLSIELDQKPHYHVVQEQVSLSPSFGHNHSVNPDHTRVAEGPCALLVGICDDDAFRHIQLDL